MATLDDVRRIALALPGTTEGQAWGSVRWSVNNKGFVWERPLRKSDRAALGGRAPRGPILGAHVEHVGIKEALVASNPRVYFTTPHFNGYPAVLVQLEHVELKELQELITDAWLARAPKRLAREWLAEQPSQSA
jgi:hypothetical protein